jgi:hypothetical protein
MESRPKDNNIRNEIDEQQKDETERKWMDETNNRKEMNRWN